MGTLSDPSSSFVVDFRNNREWSSHIRAFELIMSDFKKICEYVDPSDQNLPVYSHRIYELFLRSCTEIESNMKNILVANGYIKKDKKGKIIQKNYWNIVDYKKLEKALKLSSYKIVINFWNNGLGVKVSPYANWGLKKSGVLVWYKDYNNVKHDRNNSFYDANLGNLIDAISGLFIILFAQYGFQAFSSFQFVDEYNDYQGVFYHSASILGVIPPEWEDFDGYGFNWDELQKQKSPFIKYNFNT